MFPKSILPGLLLLLLAPLAIGQTQSSQKNPYETLLAELKQGDRSIDFKELRLAYTETAGYSPYGSNREARQTMFAALRAKEFDKGLSDAEAILAQNYIDINGHLGAMAERELGHADQSAYHRFVFEGLLNSIKNSGDGKSMETLASR